MMAREVVYTVTPYRLKGWGDGWGELRLRWVLFKAIKWKVSPTILSRSYTSGIYFAKYGQVILRLPKIGSNSNHVPQMLSDPFSDDIR
jgi:hypothetical protein